MQALAFPMIFGFVSVTYSKLQSKEVTCLQGGKSAAETILDMRGTGDYSKKSTKEYYRRWNNLYGFDFKNVSLY